MINTDRFLERKQELAQTTLRLQEACEQPFNPFIRDAVIQRFELCWELAWKTLRLWLEYLGVEALSPREIFKAALQNGLIDDGDAWSELQRMRNLTSHAYDEKLAGRVYDYVTHDGLRLFQQLSKTAAAWQPQPD